MSRKSSFLPSPTIFSIQVALLLNPDYFWAEGPPFRYFYRIFLVKSWCSWKSFWFSLLRFWWPWTDPWWFCEGFLQFRRGWSGRDRPSPCRSSWLFDWSGRWFRRAFLLLRGSLRSWWVSSPSFSIESPLSLGTALLQLLWRWDSWPVLLCSSVLERKVFKKCSKKYQTRGGYLWFQCR